MQSHHSRLVPIRMFQHPWLSVSDRILLVMSTFANEQGICSLRARSLAVLIGITGDEEPTRSQIVQVQTARQMLVRKGHLIRIGERQGASYRIVAPPATHASVERLTTYGSRMRTPVSYSDDLPGWIGSPAEIISGADVPDVDVALDDLDLEGVEVTIDLDAFLAQ